MYLSLVPVPHKKSRVVVKKVKAKYMKSRGLGFSQVVRTFSKFTFFTCKKREKYEKVRKVN